MDTTKGPLGSFYDQFISRYGTEVKPREGNNIRVLCPECKHKSLSCNIQKGIIHCFHCGYGKGIRFEGAASGYVEAPIDQELHLKVSLAILGLGSLLPQHKDYLHGRGIYHPEEYGIVSVPFRIDKLLLEKFTQEQLINSGYFYRTTEGYGVSKAIEARRILIPFWQGEQIVGLKSRARPIVDALEASTELRYICPRGSKIKNKLWYKGPLGPDVVLTEGELCAICAKEAGFSAVGIPGIAQIATSELQTAIKDLLTIDSIKRIFIILDTDPGIFTDLNKLQHALCLNNLLPNSCILYLPQDDPNEKMDLDLYLTRYSIDDITYRMEAAWILRESTTLRVRRMIEGLKNARGDQGTS
jgi:ribosomal protein L37AE/L43A